MTAKDFEAAQCERPIRVELTEDVKVRGVALKAGDQADLNRFEANTLLGLKRAKLVDSAESTKRPVPAQR